MEMEVKMEAPAAQPEQTIIIPDVTPCAVVLPTAHVQPVVHYQPVQCVPGYHRPIEYSYFYEKKGSWSEDEHRLFLAGMQQLGKGAWANIAKYYVTTRSSAQVASHAQKFFLHQLPPSRPSKRPRKRSIHDILEPNLDGLREKHLLPSLDILPRTRKYYPHGTAPASDGAAPGTPRLSTQPIGAALPAFAVPAPAPASACGSLASPTIGEKRTRGEAAAASWPEEGQGGFDDSFPGPPTKVPRSDVDASPAPAEPAPGAVTTASSVCQPRASGFVPATICMARQPIVATGAEAFHLFGAANSFLPCMSGVKKWQPPSMLSANYNPAGKVLKPQGEAAHAEDADPATEDDHTTAPAAAPPPPAVPSLHSRRPAHVTAFPAVLTLDVDTRPLGSQIHSNNVHNPLSPTLAMHRSRQAQLAAAAKPNQRTTRSMTASMRARRQPPPGQMQGQQMTVHPLHAKPMFDPSAFRTRVDLPDLPDTFAKLAPPLLQIPPPGGKVSNASPDFLGTLTLTSLNAGVSPTLCGVGASPLVVPGFEHAFPAVAPAPAPPRLAVAVAHSPALPVSIHRMHSLAPAPAVAWNAGQPDFAADLFGADYAVSCRTFAGATQPITPPTALPLAQVAFPAQAMEDRSPSPPPGMLSHSSSSPAEWDDDEFAAAWMES